MARRSYGSGSLKVRMDAAGNESWYGLWWCDGRRIKRRVGPKRSSGRADGLTKPQAEQRLRELMAEVRIEDVKEAAERPGGRSTRTLAEVGEAYIRSRDLKASTITDYRMHLRVHLVPFFGSRRLATIKASDVEDLIAVLTARGLKPKTVREYVTTLSTLLNYAVRKGWLTASPMPGVDLPPLRRDDEAEPLRFLEVHEVHDLAASALDGPYQHLDRAIYLVAALAGLRQGECRGLRWEHVDWGRGRLHVIENVVRGKRTTPKSRKVRSVPMAPQVAEALEVLRTRTEWCRPADPVFATPRTGQPMARTPLMERYREALKAAGLDPAFRFHDLRHTFGTTCARAGEPELNIRTWMGHSDSKTTQRYLHYAPAHDEAARIGRAFAVADPRGSVGGSNVTADAPREAA